MVILFFKRTLSSSFIILYLTISPYTQAALESKNCTLTPPPQSTNKTILIDPGHGGIDGGAVSKNGTLEKDINLSIGLKLRAALTASGFKVKMTRESDVGLYRSKHPVRKSKQEDLHKRCILKAETSCDVFISIHQNYFPEEKYSGAQVWYCKPPESKLLAQIIQKNLRADLDSNNKREEKSAGNLYRILKCHCEIPSVIVECGFLTNPAEELKLRDENYQQRIAASLCKSIIGFFNLQANGENKNNPNS
ncbi:N-acetylmuramoyl-L-alanine amidase CwlD [Clostridium thermarum]|uniref:N-acetylmuramoyl-L-alanine amidase CwlD n=1 Tax=Clostridium thermarum TaxID=1716543 RepID=UPI003C2D13CD